jgi:acetyl/propionyl-CoA carboxylase alpha subunit
MIAKLIVWAEDRPAAVTRLGDALAAVQVSGTRTNLAFLQRIVDTADFVEGRYDTQIVDRLLQA